MNKMEEERELTSTRLLGRRSSKMLPSAASRGCGDQKIACSRSRWTASSSPVDDHNLFLLVSQPPFLWRGPPATAVTEVNTH
jgi:hypothetical protein